MFYIICLLLLSANLDKHLTVLKVTPFQTELAQFLRRSRLKSRKEKIVFLIVKKAEQDEPASASETKTLRRRDTITKMQSSVSTSTKLKSGSGLQQNLRQKTTTYVRL